MFFKYFERFLSVFKYFEGPLSVFQGLFKANLLFKDYPVYSSTFQAYENHIQTHLKQNGPAYF